MNYYEDQRYIDIKNLFRIYGFYVSNGKGCYQLEADSTGDRYNWFIKKGSLIKLERNYENTYYKKLGVFHDLEEACIFIRRIISW